MKIREICNITMGQSPSSATYNENGDGLPFFQGAADFGKKFPMTRVWCSSPLKIAYAGDILISVRAPVGTMNIATSECCIGRGLAAIKVDEDACDSNYFWFALESKISELNNKGSGSTFKAISKSILEETEIPLPELEEQRKIAKILTGIENISFARQQQLAKLDELVKARFVEMFGDMLLNPMAWPEVALETLADIVSGITKGRKVKEEALIEVPYMAVSNVKDGYIDWTTVKTILATEREIEQYRLFPDDVLMTEGGDPDKVGRGAIIKEPLENCIHQNHIFRVRLDKGKILPAFFAEYLQHQKAKRYFLGCAKQTTGIASINMKQLKELPVLLPSLNLQQRFDEFACQVECVRTSIQEGFEQMETLKSALMQQYFE